jgi:hypothetical protein
MEEMFLLHMNCLVISYLKEADTYTWLLNAYPTI